MVISSDALNELSMMTSNLHKGITRGLIASVNDDTFIISSIIYRIFNPLFKNKKPFSFPCR
jgi:hypothetical protein